MARYFLHLRDGTDVALDPDGIECANTESLPQSVLQNAGDVIAGDAPARDHSSISASMRMICQAPSCIRCHLRMSWTLFGRVERGR